MPESLFKTSGKGGTHTKTCLIVAVKGRVNGKKASRVFMAEAKWCGQDSRAREIPFDDLPEIGKQFELFRSGGKLKQSSIGFIVNGRGIQENVLCPRYYDPEVAAELENLEQTHALVPFGELAKNGCLSLNTGDEVGKLAYSCGEIPFVRTSDISNWEIKADPKHCISKDVYPWKLQSCTSSRCSILRQSIRVAN